MSTRNGLLLLFVVFAAFALRAADAAPAVQGWRVFSGGFSSRWLTVGHHGHDQAGCVSAARPRKIATHAVAADCDATDFGRANLDNSIGFRAGIERTFWTTGPLHLVGGGESAVSYTEYNLSQRDFALVTATLFAGVEAQLGPVRVGGRHGRGAYTTSDIRRIGAASFHEVHATVPLQQRAALRISRRHLDLGGPSAVETSLLFVSAGGSSRILPWAFATSSGVTIPGAGWGGDRKLRRTAFNRVVAHRPLPFGGLDLEVSWDSTAHESSLPSTFRGYDGNYRSKTIDAYGVALARGRRWNDATSVRWSAGVSAADWRDEHQLLTRDGKELRAGIEAGAFAGAALRVFLSPRLALEASAQKVYWPRIDLSEARVGVGFVLHP